MSADAQFAVTGFGPGADASDIEREVWETLDEIPDPHIPVSLVEMAMIYDVDIEGSTATVEMTFPCMGCPAYDFIHDDIRAACRTIRGITDVDIDVVWDPIWSKDMLTEATREKMRESGIGL
jgi:metal-sulfur cluster biosynthetic enzyme